MRTVLAALLALVLTSPVALAQASLVTPATDTADVRDEPNVLTPGFFVSPPRRSPLGYPADSNGIADAMLGEGPVRVLDARPNAAGVAGPVHTITAAWLLEPFTGRDYVHPWSQVRAVYGDWNDVNGDGYIQNLQWEDMSVAELATHRDLAVESADEWVGVGTDDIPSGEAIVTYITGYSFAEADATNGAALWGPTDGHNPNIQYRTDNAKDGHYASLIYITGPFGTLDNDLIMTHVVETYHGVITPDSPHRKYLPKDGTPIDVDIFQSVDPTVESLYVQNMNELVAINHGVNGTRAGLVGFVDETTNGTLGPTLQQVACDPNRLDPEEIASCYVNPAVGPYFAMVLPVYTSETNDGFGSNPHDYKADWHPWIDIRANVGLAYPTPFLIASGSFMEVSPTADGKTHVAPGVLYPRIMHGLWHDVNEDDEIGNDGWSLGGQVANIGAATVTGAAGGTGPAPGCANGERGNDDCGGDQDPHQIGSSNSEFRGLCDAAGVDAIVTPLTANEEWPGGVYVMGDDAADGEDDNSLDDAVNDLADAKVDRYITHGAIELWSTCNASNSPFQYFSEVWLLFPAGNPTFDIRMETIPTCTNMQIVGIPVTECTKDVDLISAWT